MLPEVTIVRSAEGAADLERGGRDAAADAPDERPLAFDHARSRDEHPVRRLVDERERGSDLERECVVEREHLRRIDRDQLGVGAVEVLPDDRDLVAVVDPRVDHDAVADRRPGDAVAERFDDARAVGPEDARLRNRGKPLADPDVEMVEGRRADPDEHLARAGDGIGHLLDPEDVRAAVLVDPGSEHGTILP